MAQVTILPVIMLSWTFTGILALKQTWSPSAVVRPNMTVGVCNEGDVLTSNLGGTILDCVSTCIRTTLCYAFNYIQNYGICETQQQSEEIGNKKWLGNKSCIFSHISSWPQEIGGPCASHGCGIGEICKVDDTDNVQCIPNYCDGNSSWTNAHLHDNERFHRSLGSRLRYECNSGYFMVGEPFVECKVDEYGKPTRNASFVCYENICPYEKGFIAETQLVICLKLLPIFMTANEAMHACRAEDAETMRIESAEVQNYVEQYLTRQFDSNPSFSSKSDFIFIQGKSPESSNGEWNYEDGTQMTYTNWMIGQPDLSADINYLALRRSDNYKWHDLGPTQFLGYPLCQIKIGP